MKYKLKRLNLMRRMLFQILDYIDLDWGEPYWLICSTVVPVTVCASSRQGWGLLESLVDSLLHKIGTVNTFTVIKGGPMQNQ